MKTYILKSNQSEFYKDNIANIVVEITQNTAEARHFKTKELAEAFLDENADLLKSFEVVEA